MRLLELLAQADPGRKRTAAAAGVAIVALLAAGVAWGGTVLGTPRADVLRGTPHNDKMYGRGGNDRLYGYAGNDVLVGGPGADVLACGSGRDVAIADANDKVSRDCEVVKGRPSPSPPPPSASDERVYLALGDSISTAIGDSISTAIGASAPAKSWVRLYCDRLASSAGITRLDNLAQPGHNDGSAPAQVANRDRHHRRLG